MKRFEKRWGSGKKKTFLKSFSLPRKFPTFINYLQIALWKKNFFMLYYEKHF